MAVTKKNTYIIGSNNDLTNALAMIDINRIGEDLVSIENDGGTLKVSIGSIIESQGSVWVVETAAETPSGGPPSDGDLLFFDDSVPEFVWDSTPGTYDPERGGIYNGSDQRQCRILATGATTYLYVISPPEEPQGFYQNVQVYKDFGVTGRKLINGTYNVAGASGSISANTLFNLLSPHLPNIGDTMRCNGSSSNTNGSGTDAMAWMEFHSCEKVAADEIRLYGMYRQYNDFVSLFGNFVSGANQAYTRVQTGQVLFHFHSGFAQNGVAQLHLVW